MKYLITILLIAARITSLAQEGYTIRITLKPYKNETIYLGHYYGKQFPIIDSALLNDKSEGIFKGTKNLRDGIYFIIHPGGFMYVMIDKNYTFKISADTNQLSKIAFTGSPENVIFSNYLNYRNTSTKQIAGLYNQYKSAASGTDSSTILKQIESIQENLRQYRLDLVKKYPGSFLATMLKAAEEPVIPKNDPAAKKDSLFAYKYIQNHYWDQTQFYDARLARTPFFEGRLDNYFNRFVYPNADSVIKKMDWMLGYAGANMEMQQYMLNYFTNRYLYRNSSSDQQVFLHLFEKYFSQKNYPWLTEDSRKKISNRAYQIMTTASGKPAAEISLPGITGSFINLYNVKASYTLLVIWDPTCGHCKQLLPSLDSAYRTNWKGNDVKFFALAMETEGSKNDWIQFIKEYDLTVWTHVYYSKDENLKRLQNGLPGYSQLFNVATFPTVYLLDKDKKIIARNVTLEQVDQILKLRNN